MAKEVKARSSLESKKTRLHPDPLHVPRATRQHVHPTPPEATALMRQLPLQAGGRGLEPLSPPLPFCTA